MYWQSRRNILQLFHRAAGLPEKGPSYSSYTSNHHSDLIRSVHSWAQVSFPQIRWWVCFPVVNKTRKKFTLKMLIWMFFFLFTMNRFELKEFILWISSFYLSSFNHGIFLYLQVGIFQKGQKAFQREQEEIRGLLMCIINMFRHFFLQRTENWCHTNWKLFI